MEGEMTDKCLCGDSAYEVEPRIGGGVEIEINDWPADYPYLWLRVNDYAWGDSMGRAVLDPDEAREIGRKLLEVADRLEPLQAEAHERLKAAGAIVPPDAEGEGNDDA
jgi:hypothetical protein